MLNWLVARWEAVLDWFDMRQRFGDALEQNRRLSDDLQAVRQARDDYTLRIAELTSQRDAARAEAEHAKEQMLEISSESVRQTAKICGEGIALKGELNAAITRAQLAEETNADNIVQARTALDEKDRRIEYLELQLGAAEAHALEQKMVVEADAAEHARDAQALIEARATILQMEGDAAVLNGISEQKQDRIDRLVAAHKSLCAELRDAKEILRLVKAAVAKAPAGEPETATVHITRKQWEPNPILPTATVVDTTGENE